MSIPTTTMVMLPASELPNAARWRERARQLPTGQLLLVVTRCDSSMHLVGQRICRSLAERGRKVRVVIIENR